MEEGWYKKFVLRRFNEDLYQPKSSRSTAFYKLKTSFDYNDKCIVADSIPKNFEKYIYGNPLPDSFEVLGNSEYILNSNVIEDEINWFLLSLRKYQEEITIFLNYKSDFDKYIILGEYSKAELILDNIESEICFSIWSIENRLLLKELTNGLEDNKLYLNEINVSKGSGISLSLADFLSKRAEQDLTTNRYYNEVRNSLNRVKGVLREETIEYYLFKINYFANNDYKHYCMLNSIEFQNSIIDRYLFIRRIMQSYLGGENIGDEEKEMLRSRLYYIYSKIPNDSLIENLRVYLEPSVGYSENFYDYGTIKILDLYTEGRYIEVKDLIKEYLVSNPFAFELYEIYGKCLLNTQSKFTPINDHDNFLNLILNEVFSVLSKENQPEYSGQNLMKVALQLESTSIASQIVNFVHTETRNDTRFEKQAILNSSFVNPSFCHIYKEIGKSNEFLRNIGQIFAKSQTVNFLYHKLNRNLKDSVHELKIANNRKSIYLALFYQDEKKYDEAIILWQELKEKNNHIPHLYESIIYNLNICFFEKNLIDKSIELLVETYFINPNFLIKPNTKQIRKKIRDNRFKNVSHTICLPIFYLITDSEESSICNTYELFLAQYGITKPSEFIAIIPENIEKRFIIFFIDRVCSIDTFKHSIFIEGSEQRLQERLTLCQFLEEFDSENSSKYKDEILLLEKQTLIQKGLQEYDESKIFINKQKIVNSLLKELESDFKRYKKLSSIFEDQSILLMSPYGINAVTIKKESRLSKSGLDSLFSESPLFDIVKEMFLEVRTKFLSSEYGLSAYLSTRIRHGVFEGEIRPQFEKLKLITEKDSESEIYKTNDFWKNKLHYNIDSRNIEMQNLLSGFSQEIDSLIISIVKQNLQIKMENENKNGWFDYDFQDEILDMKMNMNEVSIQNLFFKVRDNKDFDGFVDLCFELLWKKTDINLEVIRSELRSNVLNKFEEIIEKLENSLLNLVQKDEIPELFQNINSSKVNVQNDINRIAGWFNRSGTQIKDFHMNKVVETTKESINRNYEGKNKYIELKEEINTSLLIRGDYLPYFIDLVKIFFDNILKHTNKDSGAVPTSINITANLTDNLMFLDIYNDLFGDIESEKDKIEGYLQKFEGDIAKSLTETNSGFHKVVRILKSDLGGKDNEIKIGTDSANKFYIKCRINVESLKK